MSWSRALDGNEYMPGLLGLNNMRHNDYVNVIMQVLSRVPPMRDFFLQPANYSACASPLVHRCGELLRKMWNPRNFKGQVSPSLRCTWLSAGDCSEGTRMHKSMPLSRRLLPRYQGVQMQRYRIYLSRRSCVLGACVQQKLACKADAVRMYMQTL